MVKKTLVGKKAWNIDLCRSLETDRKRVCIVKRVGEQERRLDNRLCRNVRIHTVSILTQGKLS